VNEALWYVDPLGNVSRLATMTTATLEVSWSGSGETDAVYELVSAEAVDLADPTFRAGLESLPPTVLDREVPCPALRFE